ncbi:hypothetical protein A2U01_0071617, partial [Trifolium medium]|nr:hypothetical protein [Trifolium medium]
HSLVQRRSRFSFGALGGPDDIEARETLSQVLRAIHGRTILEFVDSGESALVFEDLVKLRDSYSTSGSWIVDLHDALNARRQDHRIWR